MFIIFSGHHMSQQQLKMKSCFNFGLTDIIVITSLACNSGQSYEEVPLGVV